MSPLRRSARLRPRSKQAIKDKELDALCRRLVVELRDNNTCQRCGANERIQWAHIHTRRVKSLRWRAENSLALCAGCHLHWHHHPLEAVQEFCAKFPTRASLLHMVRSVPQKINRDAIKLWLEQEIAKLEAAQCLK